MRNAPRAYGVRMSCKFALTLFVLAAVGLFSLGWHSKTAFDQYKWERFTASELEKMKLIYQQPPSRTINIQGLFGEEESGFQQDCPPGQN